ncbi:glycerol dehydrogenase [Ligilactobacillus salitolerans]|uniref:Glycerol dehydrogenase n=1 Tax=Ligilactobacillus salitolerans TaxID=1808352 RepID=A0A401IRM0_9LACO|nr:glycerol dehydrogenase [Ligilactobacillus salitolerans]GBG94182.1 glycerol dehydrogenase [Ligilactobacillus salitolerans]
MIKEFASPAHYIQGSGVFDEPQEYLAALGSKPLLLCDATVWKIIGEKLNATLEREGFTAAYVEFGGEASDEECQRIAEAAQKAGNDFIIGLGGGKTLDTAKNVAARTKLPVAILPTVASTDAPCSALSVLYTPDGKFEKYAFYAKNPDLVLVDTRVVAHAPVRNLIAGIGDAMATNIEAKDVARAYEESMLGAGPTLASLAIAQTCADNLFAHAKQAVASAKGQVVTPALESVVEANTLLSGLGFESSGLAAAHAIYDGFTALTGPSETMMHGEKVAYGYLCELMLDQVSTDELNKYIAFNKSLGLPTTLADLKLSDVSYADLLKVGQQATLPTETMHRMPFTVTAEDVADVLVAVDQYVTANF